MASSNTTTTTQLTGCTILNQISIDATGSGFIVVTSLVKLNIEHTLLTEDRWLLNHEDATVTCPFDVYTWYDEIPDDYPTELQVQTSAFVQTVFPVASAGTYTYTLSGMMSTGESGLDQHDWSNTVAVFYPT